jgi:hypothetical protein
LKGPPLTPPRVFKGLCADIYLKRDSHPLRRSIKEEANAVLK